MNSLIVFYSRSNITKKLAMRMAEEIGADVEEIKSKVNYNGKIGYARGIKDARQEKIIKIEPPKFNPRAYEMIYLGSPVWASRAANPLISYIDDNKEKFTNVKFFLTAGGSGFESSFEQLEKICEIKPQKTLALTTKEVKNDLYHGKMTEFLK